MFLPIYTLSSHVKVSCLYVYTYAEHIIVYMYMYLMFLPIYTLSSHVKVSCLYVYTYAEHIIVYMYMYLMFLPIYTLSSHVKYVGIGKLSTCMYITDL